MRSTNPELYGFALAACAFFAGAAPASAADSSVTEARAGIQKAMDNLLAAWRGGVPVEQQVALWYTNDIILSMDGKTFRGLDSLIPQLKEWVKTPPCDWKIEDPVKASATLASAYIVETCAAKKADEKDLVVRFLYVFEKHPQGWRASRQSLTVEQK
jgi:ketosteroid isomerase-like protein